MSVERLPADLTALGDPEALNARVCAEDVSLDWSAVVSAPREVLERLLAGLDLVDHAEALGLETIPTSLVPLVDSVLTGTPLPAPAPPSASVPPRPASPSAPRAAPVPPPADSVTLSPQQQAVVNHRGGHLQVIACAGSGKTESISRRMAALIAEGVAPESIVAFTFTEKAAAELKERVARRVAERMGEVFLDRLGPMYVGTIHSYCFRLLQTHVPKYGNFEVLDENRHAGLLSREFRRLGLGKLGNGHWKTIQAFSEAADVIANELIDPDDVPGDVGECYRAYLETLERYHFLTFGRLVALAVEELGDLDVFTRVHGPLGYLFVDEYQDVNPAQEKLVEILATAPVEFCVVGDDDQSIYQWRGADVGNILTFARRYEGATTAVLDTNRRSRPGIISTANAFAATIAPRLAKTMAPHRAGAPVEVVPWREETPDDEATRIAETIERLAEKGFAYRDVAVLFRSVRTSGPPLIAALEDRNIPFACAGRTGLFLQPEPALFAQVHVWFTDGDWKDERYAQTRKVDLDAVVRGLEHHFGDGTPIPGLKRYLEDWKRDRLAGNRSVSLVGDFYRLLQRLGVERIDPDTKSGAARLGAFARFSQILADFEHVTRRGRYLEEEGRREFRGGQDRGLEYAKQLTNYLCHYAFDAYEEFEGEPAADLDAVQVLTVHQAKGLEWPVVFLPALVARRFPSQRTGQARTWLLPDSVFPSAIRSRYEGSETEERRLFYVAMTRARDALYLSRFERQTNAARPSPFLVEAAGGAIPKLGPLPLPDPPEPAGTRAVPPLTLSFSALASYDDCGYRYRLGTSFGFQQELAPELGYGKAIHHVLRQLAERSRADGRIPTAREALDLVDTEFYTPFANRPSFERMKAAAERLVRSYLARWKDDLGRVWATERPFELHLPDGVLSGRADVILTAGQGRPDSLAIVDYKASTDPRREEHFALQLAVYTAAGRGEGLTVEAAYLHDLHTGDRRDVNVGEGVTRTAVEKVGALAAGIRRGAFPAKPTKESCGACDLTRVCRHSDAGTGTGGRP